MGEKSELEERIDYLEESIKKIIRALNALSEMQEFLYEKLNEHNHLKTIDQIRNI